MITTKSALGGVRTTKRTRIKTAPLLKATGVKRAREKPAAQKTANKTSNQIQSKRLR